MSEFLSKNIPSRIYKYIDWRNDYHKKLLTEKEIYFCSPKKLNDPLDCQIPLRYDLEPKEFILFRMVQHLHRENPIFNKGYYYRKAERIYQNRDRNIALQDSIDFVTKKVGIFSTSFVNNELKLWQCYANNHTGICIELNGEVIQNELTTFGAQNRLIVFWDEVIYKDKNFIMLPSKLSVEDSVRLPLITKNLDWEYEKEFRFFMLDQQDYPFQFESEIISSIIFGANIKGRMKEDILGKIAGRDIVLKQEEIDETTGEIRISLLN